MAKKFKEDLEREDEHGLTPEEHAFYDALANNQSAKDKMGEDVLGEMAREIASKLRSSLTVDWAVRESVRARMRVNVRTLLRKYKYPPDQRDDAIDTVIDQAEVLSEELAA